MAKNLEYKVILECSCSKIEDKGEYPTLLYKCTYEKNEN